MAQISKLTDIGIIMLSLIVGYIFYQIKKNKLQLLPFIHAFFYVFIAGMLIYEFIQFIMFHHTFSFYPFLMYFVLTILLLTLRKKLTQHIYLLIILTAWVFGMSVLFLAQPFVTVIGFSIHFIFVLIISIAGFVTFLLQKDYPHEKS